MPEQHPMLKLRFSFETDADAVADADADALTPMLNSMQSLQLQLHL